MILKVTAIAAVVAAAVAGASPATGELGCRAAVAARGYTFTATTVDGVPQSRCAAATVSDAFGSVVRRRFLRSALTLSGMLLDSTGAPAAAVPVVVQASPLAGGGPAAVAQATTDAKGRYTLAVAEGESRLLTVQAGGSERMVEELVAPSVWLSVRARPHARVLFFGGLIDGDATSQPTVTLQDATPEGWRTFAAIEPRSAGRHAGRFAYLYRSAPETIGSSFRFRATTMPTPAWEPGVSKVHEATVR
jgi:hypothetical protein